MEIRFNQGSEFDWYEATLPVGERSVLAVLERANARELKQITPKLGYEVAYRGLDESGERVWDLLYGGNSGKPHVIASGSHAQRVAEILREDLPDHHVTRVDVAIDRAEPGLFDRLLPEFLDISKRSGMKAPCAGEWHSPETARTIYMGAPSSRVRVRMYEKEAEVRAKYSITIPDLEIPAGWVRFEAQLRPTSPTARVVLAKATPELLWGASPAMRALIAQINGMEPPRLSLNPKKVPSTAVSAIRHMVKQYGKAMRRFEVSEGRDGLLDFISRELDRA